MIKDFSDNKNKYFIKDTNFDVLNEDNMLQSMKNFDFESSDNDPYNEIDNINDEKGCHFPYSNVSFCWLKISSLKGDILNMDFQRRNF